MKPLPGDHRHRLIIRGDELDELKRHTGSMAEAFGLDRKIENYQGTRPITLYRWDLDCLMDVIDLALEDERDYPDQSSPGYHALKRLGERLRREYDRVYGHEKALSAAKSKEGAKPRKKAPLGKSARKKDPVYQLKITLIDTQPPIWRRIQVQDCTLDHLHDHIQKAMGWTNSHLHEFEIGKQLYGEPELLAENFEDVAHIDSTTTRLSDIIPEGCRRFRFFYEYDFGDSWRHEILFEKKIAAEAGQKYPRCVDGARACPPEDAGGTWGYAQLVKAIQNKNKQHDVMLEWVGDSFDPEAFDPAAVTKRMK
jgi:pRiA4b ORF-3-like protein